MLKILNASQIKQWDDFTIQNEPVSPIDLMDRAAGQCVAWLLNDAQSPICKKRDRAEKKKIKIFCGPGNNGGDGLVVARMLQENGYQPEVFIVSESLKSSREFDHNLQRLKNVTGAKITEVRLSSEVEISVGDVVIDALLGSGLSRPLRGEGLIYDVVLKINESGATVIAIDVPSGFPCDVVQEMSVAVRADFTLSFQLPKLRMLFPDSYAYTGELAVLDIGLLPAFNLQSEGNHFYITAPYVAPLLKKRRKFDHKGTFGHALLIAGSYGKMGAAVLASRACLRSGAGLLTAAIPKSGIDIMQISVPEAMAYAIEEHERYVSSFPKINIFKSIGIGPGMEKKPVTKLMLRNLLMQAELPGLVIDADGLNLLPELIQENHGFKIPENAILTPHVKEFDRLAGPSAGSYERHGKQIAFSQKHKVYIVLKGAYSCITTPEGKCYFNSTGNPGMGTGGSGDVLTGLLTGLLAQGYSPLESCLLGVFVHGLAGDNAAKETGQEGLVADDIIKHIGRTMKDLGAMCCVM